MLVALGWALLAYAVGSSFGDPAPWVTQAELQAMHRHAMICGFGGSVGLLAAVWLAGFAFVAARARAAVAMLGVFVPFAVLFWFGLG